MRQKRAAGFTLIEAMATMVVLAIGIAGIAVASSQIGSFTRRNLTQAQAMMIAEWELERLTNIGCDGVNPNDRCANLKSLHLNDPAQVQYSVFWTAAGTASTASTPGAREYRVAIDVDPPFEGAETSAPSLLAPLPNTGQSGDHVNIRVTVMWEEEGHRWQAVALQTRVAP